MKKFLLSLLTAVYLFSASGLAMQVHYCMGEKVGFEFFHSKDEKCGKCGMTERKGCCSDENRFFKLSLDHNVSGSVVCPEWNGKLLFAFHEADIRIPSVSFSTIASHNPSPPVPSGIDRCRLHCVYRL